MRKYKIAIIENDEDERFFMEEEFDASGLFEIIAMFRNGDTLLDWLEQNIADLPEIILSDLNMPGKNGYDIITEIRGTPTYAHIPVVITSTSSIKSVMDRCLALGAADYLVKPEIFVAYSAFVKDLYERIQRKELVK